MPNDYINKDSTSQAPIDDTRPAFSDLVFPENYKKYLELVVRTEYQVETCEGITPVYLFDVKGRKPESMMIINMHGGGFVFGRAPRDDYFCAKMAYSLKALVIDIDYRLAPEFQFPVAFNECYDVTKWAFSKAKEWGVDPERVCIMGHSAGGNLAAAISLKAYETKDFRFMLQVLDYPPLDQYHDMTTKPIIPGAPITPERSMYLAKTYVGEDLEKTKSIYCSPALASDELIAGMPETLMITAELDYLRFDAEALVIRMIAAGVRVTAQRFPTVHGFTINCMDYWEEAQKLIIRIIQTAGQKDGL